MPQVPQRLHWPIGMALLGTMVLLFLLAITRFEGPTSVILLVVAGFCLLVGVYLVMGGVSPSGRSRDPPSPPSKGT